jgi:hypothetical protein
MRGVALQGGVLKGTELLDPAMYIANNPKCFVVRADLDTNGFIARRETQTFVRCVTGGGCL